MDLFPLDLGTRLGVSVVQARANSTQGGRGQATGNHPLSSPIRMPFGPLGRFITGGTGLSDAAKAELLKGMGGVIGGSVGGIVGGSCGFMAPTIVGLINHHPEISVIFGTLWLGMASFGFILPRIMFTHWVRQPVALAEIEGIFQNRDDNLERAFLALIRDAMQQEVPAEVSPEVRKAIRALAEAIDRLPPLGDVSEMDANRLRQEAERVEQEATIEADSVSAASLLRQAEALRRSAQAAERSMLVLRRNTLLRQELVAQAEALRLGLASLYAGAGDVAGLAQLAEKVREVANNADAVADARNELDSFMSRPQTMEDATAGVNPSPVTVLASTPPPVAETTRLGVRKG